MSSNKIKHLEAETTPLVRGLVNKIKYLNEGIDDHFENTFLLYFSLAYSSPPRRLHRIGEDTLFHFFKKVFRKYGLLVSSLSRPYLSIG